MSDEIDIPAEWRVLLERKGIKPSYRDLGARAGISHEAARRVVRGWSVREATVRKVASALGVDPEAVRELRGEPTHNPWEPPRASSLLSHDEREALSRLISLMTAGRTEEGDGSGHHAASNTGAREGLVKRVRSTPLGKSGRATAARPQPPQGTHGTDPH